VRRHSKSVSNALGPEVISDSPHRQKSECSRESKPPRTGARCVGIAPWNRAQDCIGFAFGLSLPTKCEGSEILRWWGSEWLPRFPRQCRLLAAWLSTFRLKIAEEPSRARTLGHRSGEAQPACGALPNRRIPESRRDSECGAFALGNDIGRPNVPNQAEKRRIGFLQAAPFHGVDRGVFP